MLAERPDQPASFEPSLLDSCQTERLAFATSERVAEADVIVVSTRWSETGLDGLPALASWVVRNTQARLIVLGRTAEFPDVPRLLARNQTGAPKRLLATSKSPEPSLINEALQKKVPGSGAPSFPKMHGSALPRPNAMPSTNKAGLQYLTMTLDECRSSVLRQARRHKRFRSASPTDRCQLAWCYIAAAQYARSLDHAMGAIVPRQRAVQTTGTAEGHNPSCRSRRYP